MTQPNTQPNTNTGTSGSDNFSSVVEEQNASADSLSVAAFDTTSFRTFGGDDSVEGIASVSALLSSEGTTGIGIVDSVVDVGTDNDSITFSGLGSGVQFGEGFGIRRTTVDGRGGQDIINITGLGASGISAIAGALDGSTVNGGLDNDILNLTSELAAAEGTTPNGTSVGIDAGSQVNGNAGEDAITLRASALIAGSFGDFLANSDNDQMATAIAINQQSFVQGGLGNDALEIVADSAAVNAISTAVSASEVFGGVGDDVINVSASASGFRSAASTGLDNDSTLFGGQGNDAITISATNVAAPTAFDVQSIGIRNSAVNGGQGSDTIIISAADRVQNSSVSTGAENAQIRGGRGDDTIEVSSRAGGGFTPGTANGLLNSEIRGGEGNDRITVSSFGNEPRDSYGARGSRIFGGLGDDTIEVSVNRAGILDITDTLIAGGDGNDTFNVGIGDGTIRGGSGADTIVLDFLDDPLTLLSAPTSVAEVNGGIEITSVLSKSGSLATGQLNPQWTQKILGVENYQVGSDVFSASELVANITASVEAVSA